MTYELHTRSALVNRRAWTCPFSPSQDNLQRFQVSGLKKCTSASRYLVSLKNLLTVDFCQHASWCTILLENARYERRVMTVDRRREGRSCGTSRVGVGEARRVIELTAWAPVFASLTGTVIPGRSTLRPPHSILVHHHLTVCDKSEPLPLDQWLHPIRKDTDKLSVQTFTTGSRHRFQHNDLSTLFVRWPHSSFKLRSIRRNNTIMAIISGVSQHGRIK